MTSYAVSPQSTFTCLPCSVRLRPQGVDPRRLTYCSITTPKQRLQCFSEISSSRPSQGREFHTFSADVLKAESPIVHLEFLPADEEEDVGTKNRLLAIHRDGEIRCFSQDLQCEEWKTKINSGAGGARVEFALAVSLEEAQQSLLKNREDILAMLGGVTNRENVYIMLIVTRASQMAHEEGDSALTFRIIHVGALKGTRTPILELTSFTLPETEGTSLEDSKYSWYGANGSLLRSTSTTLSVHDLSGSLPKLRHCLKLRGDTIVSNMRLSPTTVALTRAASISIIDLQYHSLQAQSVLGPSSTTLPNIKKQKPKQNVTNHLRLTSYYAPLDLVTALRGRELLAIQLSELKQSDNGSRKRKRDSLLVNSLGRGLSSINQKYPEPVSLLKLPKSVGTNLPSCQSLDGWQKQQEDLDSLLAQKDFDGFERIISAELGIVKGSAGTDPYVLLGGEEHPLDTPSPNICKVYYVLSKIFSFEKSQKPNPENDILSKDKLKISWFPGQICHWLIGQGLFSPSQVETSLKMYEALPTDESIKFGEYTQAIAEWDQSFEVLQFILRSPVPLDINEIVHCLSHLISYTIAFEVRQDMKLLTNGENTAIGKLEQNLKRDETSLSIGSPSPFQESDQRKFIHTLLESILTRLNVHAKSKVTQALKAQLSPLELGSLVDLLREEIAQGQWLSSYVEANKNHASDEFTENGRINTIAILLNCTMDSLGTGGWALGSLVGEDLTQAADTIAYMKAEISAALEGIEEATYLKGMLREILLFDKNSRSKNQNLLPMGQFISQTRSSIGGISDSGSSLPLGLRITQDVSRKKVGAGGEILERSQRDIGRHKSQMVGKYSFDRIII